MFWLMMNLVELLLMLIIRWCWFVLGGCVWVMFR